jgi:hypothetical protein
MGAVRQRYAFADCFLVQILDADAALGEGPPRFIQSVTLGCFINAGVPQITVAFIQQLE